MSGHRPSIWVVEIWDGKLSRWIPTIGGALTKKECIEETLPDWCRSNPDDRFRVAKYIREAKP